MHEKDQELIDLLARCALKDQRALKEIYNRVAPFMNGVAFRILRSDELSNEVLQEAFVQVWEHAGDYRESKAKPLTWMTSIVRYRAIDRLKAEQRHQRKLDYDAETHVLDNLASPSAPDTDFEKWQMKGFINDCLNEMNEKLKLSIELAYLGGYSREELAERFGTKVNTVKSWLHRGSERLRQCLKAKTQMTV